LTPPSLAQCTYIYYSISVTRLEVTNKKNYSQDISTTTGWPTSVLSAYYPLVGSIFIQPDML
jgi:hypothetical protein